MIMYLKQETVKLGLLYTGKYTETLTSSYPGTHTYLIHNNAVLIQVGILSEFKTGINTVHLGRYRARPARIRRIYPDLTGFIRLIRPPLPAGRDIGLFILRFELPNGIRFHYLTEKLMK
jgi:hypothetical protein